MFPAVLATVGNLGLQLLGKVAQRRHEATINQANLDLQREINSENMAFQRSAVSDRYNQLVGLGMSRQAALQAASGASYSPSSQATILQSGADLSTFDFSTLGNMLQLEEQKRMNDAELDLKKEALKQSEIETWEKQYGKESIEVRDKILEYVFGDNGLSLADINDVSDFMSKLPAYLRIEASRYNIPNTVIADMISDYKQSHMESIQLRMLHTDEQLKEIALGVAISDAELAKLKNKEDMERYPILAEINLEAVRAAMQEAKANATYADLMVKAQLSQEQALALSAMIDEEYMKEHPNQEKFLRGLKRWLEPFNQILGGASTGVATAAAVRGMNRPGRKK